MNNQIVVYASPDCRYKTEFYEKDDGSRFCLSEKTRKGTLITEFSRVGEVTDQVYFEGKSPEISLQDYLGRSILVEKAATYEKIKVSASCRKCGGGGKIARELDLKDIALVNEVPVVPIFRCTGCGERFYAMSEEYLGKLVSRNEELFKEEELAEIRKDRMSSIKQLNEYIIRIFASKRITRLVIEE